MFVDPYEVPLFGAGMLIFTGPRRVVDMRVPLNTEYEWTLQLCDLERSART
jgi:hypothetical protein